MRIQSQGWPSPLKILGSASFPPIGPVRFLLCLTGAPEFQLAFCDVLRMKTMASSMVGVEITRISISPKDNHMVAASGRNYFRILRVQENSFISLTDNIKRLSPNQNFTDHVWFEETKIVLANDRAEIFIIHENDVKQYLNNAFDTPGPAVTCLLSLSKGFLVGSDSGHFALWVRGDDNQRIEDGVEIAKDLQFLKKWRSERKSYVVAMDVTRQEDLVAVAFANNDICTIEMAQVLPNSTEVLGSYQNNEKFLKREVKFDFLFNGFHNGPVTHMDVCLQRPLIVTASKFDSTIRIWNYAYPRCELARKFYLGDDGNQQGLGTKENQVGSAELSPLCSVGFHPSGYYIAAGFLDKLRIFHVLHSELKPYKEMAVKSCTQVKFSNGGHMLAAAYPRPKSNHYYINVYEAYTMEFLHTLKGHTNQITEIVFGIRDTFIASCGQDGAIYEWSTSDWARRDYCYNNNKYSSLIYDPPIGMLLAAGTENVKDREQSLIETKSIVRELRVIPQGQNPGPKDQYLYDLGQQRICQLTYIQSLYNQCGIIGGTESGQIKVFSYIFNQLAFQTVQVHQGEVTKIRCSPDGRYVFTAGSDGSVFIFSVSEMQNDGQVYGSKTGAEAKEQLEDLDKINPKAGVVDENLADVLLVSRNEIESYIMEMKKLQNDLQDLDQKTDFKVLEEKRKVEKEKSEIEKKMNAEIAAWATRYDQLKAQKSTAEKDAQNLFKNVENNHLKAVEELENLYERKLAFENEKYLQLEQQLMEERMKHQQQIKEFERKHTEYIEGLKQQFKDNFYITEKALENNKCSADQLKKTYEEILAQCEDDHEYEIKDLNQKHSKEIEALNKKLATADSQAKQEKINTDNAKNELMEKEKRVKDLELEKQSLESKYKDALNKIEVQARELEERDDQLKKKEKKIYEYKYKISDLQKSKHVLSYRTTEMKKSLEPKEAQIDKLKQELFKLEQEFAAMLKVTKDLDNKEKEIKSKNETLSNELNQQIELTKKKENIIQSITMDIYKCVHYKDQKLWVAEMNDLYKNYVVKEDRKQRENDPRSIEEMNRHINHLEKSAIQINKSTEKMMLRRDKEIYKRMNENQHLIHELNEIRKQKKDNETEINNLRIEKDKLETENKKLKLEIAKYGDGKQRMHQDVQLDISQDNFRNQAPLLPPFGAPQQRVSSQPPKLQKQKICRGPNFDKQSQLPYELSRMKELAAQLQVEQNKNQSMESIIRNLRKFLKDRGLEDPIQDDEMEQSQLMANSQGFARRI